MAGGSPDFALARYLPNGTLDITFGGDGTVLTDFGSGSLDDGLVPWPFSLMARLWWPDIPRQ